MKYLLIDFGASYIKSSTYDTDSGSVEGYLETESPFLNNSSINKNKILSIISNLKKKYSTVDRIVGCSILGGGYKADVYYTWKNPQPELEHCLFSGLFTSSSTYHILNHHRNTVKASSYVDGLEILGMFEGIPFYSGLGDTNCVIKSLDLNSDEIGINLGTGSQVFFYSDEGLRIYSYIPSGRSFLVFSEFFKSIGIDFFSMLSNLTIDDICNSTLKVDLNNFKESHKFKDGGSLSNIIEGRFNITNLLSSILLEYVHQYKEYVIKSRANTIILTGGIPVRLPLIKDIFSYVFPQHNINPSNTSIPNTHEGIIKFIDENL